MPRTVKRTISHLKSWMATRPRDWAGRSDLATSMPGTLPNLSDSIPPRR